MILTLVVFATAGAACNAVLGLDEPTLDPCANGCVDGAAPSSGDAAPIGSDGAAVVDATPPPIDASPDQGPVTGIRCGGGSSPTIGCEAPSPVCCLEVDGGSASYSCQTSAAACGGYPIRCATNNDCSGTEVCCHYASSIECIGEATCTNNALVCDPNGPTDQCPAGWKCSVAFTSGAYTMPYYGCTP